MTCPSCQEKLSSDTCLCPNCGALVYEGQGQAQKIPDFNTVVPQSPTLITKNKGGDIILGIICTGSAMLTGGLDIIAIPIIYLIVREKYPVFVHTMIITWVISFTVFYFIFYKIT